MIHFNFFTFSHLPESNILFDGIKIGSYPKPLVPFISVEILLILPKEETIFHAHFYKKDYKQK